MARTPLLSKLQKLFAHHLAARRLGLPLEACYEKAGQLRDRRIASGIDPDRRRIVLGAGAAAGALLAPRWARAGVPQPVIAIVGGGIAGLNCALQLKDHGIASTVYEASGRLGGRMFSNNKGFWKQGQVSEWGGELIDTGHFAIRNLAKRYALPLDDLLAAQPENSTGTFYFDGEYYRASTATEDFQAVVDALAQDVESAPFPTLWNAYTPEAQVLDQMTVYDWIESRVPGGHDSTFGKLLDVAYATEYGANTTEQAALNLIYLLAYQPEPDGFEFFGVSDERFHVRGGNAQIPLAIADELGVGSAVKTRMELVRLRKTPGQRYELTFDTLSGTEVVVADVMVLALPFAVLHNLDTAEAGFDDRKRLAIRTQGRGRNGKLQLQFDERIWRRRDVWGPRSTGDSYTDVGYQQTWEVTRAQAGTPGILNIYTCADVTLSMTTERAFATSSQQPAVVADAQTFLAKVETVFPGLSAQWNGRATQTLPHLSRFFRNSYSFYRPGQYTTFAGYEGWRQGGIYFAGEHTSINYQGYMEGGAETGALAAGKILRRLGIEV